MADLYEALLGKTLSGGGGGGSATLITKNITANGTYDAIDDEADGYSAVSVDVPNTYTSGDEGKVVDNGTLVAQTSESYNKNGSYDTTTVSSIVVNVSQDTKVFNSTKSNLYTQKTFSTSWVTKNWNGLTNFNGDSIWTDGDNIYYSSGSNQYVLDKSTSTWSAKTWNGLTSFDGAYIWSDGDDIYYCENVFYKLNKATSTWGSTGWTTGTGSTPNFGNNVWTDGENIYYSSGSDHSVFDKTNRCWNIKTWSGLTSFYGMNIFSSSDKVIFYNGSTYYYLDKSNYTWVSVTTSYKPASNGEGRYMWSDGTHLYNHWGNSSGGQVATYIYGTGGWGSVTFTGINNFYGNRIWTDGNNIYYSSGTNQYVLSKTLSVNVTQPSASCKPKFT